MDPITAEQNFNKDTRPFAMVHAYLFAATKRGLMDAKLAKQSKAKVDYKELDEEINKERRKIGNVQQIKCQYIENKELQKEYNNSKEEEDIEDEDEEEYE